MRRVFFTAMMVSWAIIATNAQTADNLPTSIGWQMGNGTITEAPDFTPEVARQFILKTEIVKGTSLNNPVAKTSDVVRTRLQIWYAHDSRYGVIDMV